MVMLIDAKKPLTKFNDSMIKVLERVELERMFLSTINGLHEKCTVSVFLNEEKHRTVPSKSRIRGPPTLPTPFQ